jgi:hypothetical protein
LEHLFSLLPPFGLLFCFLQTFLYTNLGVDERTGKCKQDEEVQSITVKLQPASKA